MIWTRSVFLVSLLKLDFRYYLWWRISKPFLASIRDSALPATNSATPRGPERILSYSVNMKFNLWGEAIVVRACNAINKSSSSKLYPYIAFGGDSPDGLPRPKSKFGKNLSGRLRSFGWVFDQRCCRDERKINSLIDIARSWLNARFIRNQQAWRPPAYVLVQMSIYVIASWLSR